MFFLNYHMVMITQCDLFLIGNLIFKKKSEFQWWAKNNNMSLFQLFIDMSSEIRREIFGDFVW